MPSISDSSDPPPVSSANLHGGCLLLQGSIGRVIFNVIQGFFFYWVFWGDFFFLVGCCVYGFVFGSGRVELDLCCFVGPDLWIAVLGGVLMLFGFVFGDFFMGSFCFSACL